MSTVKLQTLSFREHKTYLFATIFVVGNLLLPQLCHLFNMGGVILLPIYFFTLIASYRYGIAVGLMTAILSPLTNSMLFGMPPAEILPMMILKSILLAIGASVASRRANRVSFAAILLAIIFYQVVGGAFEWIVSGSLMTGAQDFLVGYPGLLMQLIGGWIVLKLLYRV